MEKYQILGNKNKVLKPNKFNNKLFDNIDEEIAMKMEKYKKPNQDRLNYKKSLLKIPEPVVYKNECAVKALHVFDENILLGTDQGEIKLLDKYTFKEIQKQTFIKAPVLSIQKQMYAFLIQHKDAVGSILLLKVWKTAKGVYDMKQISVVQTMVSTFTQFASTMLYNYQGEFEEYHITIVTPSDDDGAFPKIWVLNSEATEVIHQQKIEIVSNQSDVDVDDTEGGDKRKKGLMPQTQDGNISCIKVRERQKVSAANVMAQVMGQTEEQKGDAYQEEPDHEVLLGYESGAIGLFKIALDKKAAEGKFNIDFLILISPQNVNITDVKTKHVLSLLPLETKKAGDIMGSNDFKLIVGYYARFVQSFDVMESSNGSGYVFLDQKQSDVTYQEKPGISALSSVRIEQKLMLCQGGFDFRVRLFSAKTLKMLMSLEFHKAIINAVHIELSDDKSKESFSGEMSRPGSTLVNVYSVSEDGYLCCWNNLEV